MYRSDTFNLFATLKKKNSCCFNYITEVDTVAHLHSTTTTTTAKTKNKQV